MNQIKAARESLDKILAFVAEAGTSVCEDLEASLKPAHLIMMVEEMESAVVEPQWTFSDGKAGRWLGWIQAAGTAMGALTLEQCKEINRKWAE